MMGWKVVASFVVAATCVDADCVLEGNANIKGTEVSLSCKIPDKLTIEGYVGNQGPFVGYPSCCSFIKDQLTSGTFGQVEITDVCPSYTDGVLGKMCTFEPTVFEAAMMVAKPSDKCCSAVKTAFDYAMKNKAAAEDPATAPKVLKDITALEKAQVEACADVKDRKTLDACIPRTTMMVAEPSDKCCLAVKTAYDYAMENKDAAEDPATAPKVLKDITALEKAQAEACVDVKDRKTLGACIPRTTMMAATAEKPPTMLAGFCGFLAGAAVVGLAAGLKKRSQTAMEQQLMA